MNWKKQVVRFISAQTISLFGSSIVQYAIIWHITLHTQSGWMMSIATICGFLPQILISLFAGVWVDRYSRKLMCILPDVAIAIVTTIIMILFMAGIQNVELLFLVLLIRSAMTGIQMPAVSALVPQIVPQKKLMKVNGIHGTITSLMNFLAPACSAFVLSLLAIEYTFLIDVITAVIATFMMLTLRVPEHVKGQTQMSMKEDLYITKRYLKTFPKLMGLLAFMFIVCFFISPAAFLTPLMITRNFGTNLSFLSISEMIFSLGAVVGGVLITSWGGFKRHSITLITATILYGSMMIGLGYSWFFLMYLFFNFMIGISMPCFNTPAQVIIQERVKPEMHGRIFSLIQIANACALPLGTAIFGPLADLVPVQYLFVVCGAIVVILGIVAFLMLGKMSTVGNVDSANNSML